MQPDDPRHGTYAGAVAHWLEDSTRPCPPCHKAEGRYRKQRKMKHLRGEMVTFPAIGIVRRLQALQAVGWTGPKIAAECGLSVNTLRSPAYHDSGTVWASTARAVIDAYERMCMTRPEGRYADRARNMAKTKGYAPPLSWDDIDDPTEQPIGVYVKPTRSADINTERRAKRLADLEHAVDQGWTVDYTAEWMGINKEALETWCRRMDRRDISRALIRNAEIAEIGAA